MVALFNMATVLLADALRFVILSLRTSRSLAAENVFLRRSLYILKSGASSAGE